MAAILIAHALLWGCGPVNITKITPTSEPWTNYVMNVEQETATGATMVEWVGHALFLPGYSLRGPLRVDRIGAQPVSDGTMWVARYNYGGACSGGRYVATTPRFYNETIGIIVAEDGTIPCEKSVLQIAGLKKGRQWSTPEAVGTRPFTRGPFLAGGVEAAIKWELLYSGRSGDEITLDYREYSATPQGTFARPAFYQQLRYDLHNNDRIVFRSMEIQIVEASNSGVKFRVLRDAERDVTGTDRPLAPRQP
jgi:hypothetical protein